MRVEGNDKRIVYARFNFHLIFAEQLRRNFVEGQAAPTYLQDNRPPSEPFKIDAELDSVDFFTDEDMTNKVYSFKP